MSKADTLVLKLDDLSRCHNQERRLNPDHWRPEDGTCRCHPPRAEQVAPKDKR
jgi:hypothetical protein